MYNIAICEDNLTQAEMLGDIIKQIEASDGVTFQVDKYASGEALLKADYNKYHILILDIHLEALSGIEVAKIIRQSNKEVKIIFVTAHEQYWPEGYIVSAYRFLLKPVDTQEFIGVIRSIIQLFVEDEQFVVLKGEDELEKVRISDIRYLAIEGRSVAVYAGGKRYSSQTLMRQWIRKLEVYGFAQTHMSYFVNLRLVKRVSKEQVTLTTGENIYISQRKYKEFRERFIEYVSRVN